jgi:hypothetical protein
MSSRKRSGTGALATLLKVSSLGAIGLAIMFLCTYLVRSACNYIREEDQAHRREVLNTRLIRTIDVARPVDQASASTYYYYYYWAVLEQQAALLMDLTMKCLGKLREAKARISARREKCLEQEGPGVRTTKDLIRRLRAVKGDKDLIERLSTQLREANAARCGED